MIFAEIDVKEAEGLLLVHSVGRVKKGRVLSKVDIESLQGLGIQRVFAAKLEEDDVPEDEAARAIANVLAGADVLAQAPFTGRANLHSEKPGLLRIDGQRLAQLNLLDEALTIATLPDFSRVEARQLLATVKIIPYALKRTVLQAALEILADCPLVSVAEFQPLSFGLIITETANSKPSVSEKSRRMMDERLQSLGSKLGVVEIVAHDREAVEKAISNLAPQHDGLLIFGASAIADRADIVPQAVLAAGGEIVRLGMPVDPGNLLLWAAWQNKPVIGVPSCARSPKVNGFDWVLQRVVAGLSPSSIDIAAMGEGGLLMEVGLRPTPREGGFAKAPQVAGIVLAAGQSSRMGSHKMLMDFNAAPMVTHAVNAAISAGLSPVIVVTGREGEAVKNALAEKPVIFTHNAGFAAGLASSLQAGIRALPEEADGAVVLLGDMPLITGDIVKRLVAAFQPLEGRRICVAAHDGEIGNPVLWGRDFFAELLSLSGDRGGRALLSSHAEWVVEVEAGSSAIFKDFDELGDFG